MAIAFSSQSAAAQLAACLTAQSQANGVSVDGTTGLNGFLVLGTSALTPNSDAEVLCKIPLQIPSFTISGHTATINGSPLFLPSANGVAALAELRDGSDTTVVSGLTVVSSPASGNVVLTTTTLVTTIPVSITSGQIVSP